MPGRDYGRYKPPTIRYFNRKRYTLTAASGRGVPKGDAEHNQAYMKRIGFRTRRVKVRSYYYVYAIKK